MQKVNLSRRKFLKKAAGLAPLILSGAKCSENSIVYQKERKKMPVGNNEQNPGGNSPTVKTPIARRVLGKTGLEISLLAFGGGSQFMVNKDGDWEKLLQQALDMGINYFDTSSSYNGSEERYSEILPAYRSQVIVATKFDSRDVDAMKKEVEASLKRLKMDYVDVLLIHSIENNDSVAQIGNGVYKEMQSLKEQNIVKNIGFSSMNSAARSKELLEKLDFDVVLLAMNPTSYGDFTSTALPAARAKDVGVLVIKVMRDIVGKAATAEELMRYALDQEGVSGAVIGHTGMNILNQNIQIAQDYAAETFVPYDRFGLEMRLKPYAGPHALCWARPDYVDRYFA